jgi:hypothetical protein
MVNLARLVLQALQDRQEQLAFKERLAALASVRLARQVLQEAWQPQMSKYSWQAELGLNQLVQNPLKFKLSVQEEVADRAAKEQLHRCVAVVAVGQVLEQALFHSTHHL